MVGEIISLSFNEYQINLPKAIASDNEQISIGKYILYSNIWI